MDTGAELTLHIARRAQAHGQSDPAQPVGLWTLWPSGERLEWEGARALLSGLPKPVLVAPLLEPGMLGLWTLDTLDAANRQRVGRGIANQIEYYGQKLTALGAARGLVRFGAGASSAELTGDAFLRWAAEYAINVGISLEASDAPGVVRVRLRPPGGGPPLTL